MRPIHLRTISTLLSLLLSMACESEPPRNTSACQPGARESCECSPGQTGQRMCLMTMSFGACMCVAPRADAGSQMDAAPSADASESMDAGFASDVSTTLDAQASVDASANAKDAQSSALDAASVVIDSGPSPMDAGVVAMVDSGPSAMDAGSGGSRPSCAAVINPAAHTFCLDILTSVGTGTSALARVRFIRSPSLADPGGIQFDLVSDVAAIALPGTSVVLAPTNTAAPSYTVAANNVMSGTHLPGSVTTLMFSLDPNARTVSMNGDLIEFLIVSRGLTGDFELMFDNIVVSDLSANALPFAFYNGTIKVR
jgi:hypothetical protein